MANTGIQGRQIEGPDDGHELGEMLGTILGPEEGLLFGTNKDICLDPRFVLQKVLQNVHQKEELMVP